VDDSLYDDPFYYRLLFDGRSHDLPFYQQLAKRCDGPILELGVGTGRVAFALARAGHEVVGVDSSESMLAVLRDRVCDESREVGERLTSICGDACAIDVGRQFPLVLFPFNGMAHLHYEEERQLLLANVARHLQPSGRFAFDVTVPDPALLEGATSTVPWFRHPQTGEVCRCDEAASYDPSTQVLTFTATIRFMEAEREPQVMRWSLRQFSNETVGAMLDAAGFELLQHDESLQDAVGYVARLRSRRF
jgi:SAM-dependent methyltransferase